MTDIFISYASQDRQWIDKLQAVLVRCGWSVWWDRDIPPGFDFSRVIQKALNDAGCVIVAWSRSSIESDWVRDEAEEAKQRQVLVPLLIDDVNPPLGFRRLQVANMTNWGGQTNTPELLNLLKGIETMLGPPPRGLPIGPSGKEAVESRLVPDEERRRVGEYFAKLLDYETGFPTIVLKIVLKEDNSVEASIFAANDAATELYGLNPMTERLTGMSGNEVVEHLEQWMNIEDLKPFLLDQQRVFSDYLLQRQCYPSVPIRFTERHPHERFKNRQYLPVIFAYSGLARLKNRSEQLMGVMYLDLDRVPN